MRGSPQAAGDDAAACADAAAPPGVPPPPPAPRALHGAAAHASRWTLRFREPLESAFRRHWDAARARTHDKHAASIYLAMVVCGYALLLLGRQREPLLGDGCDTLVAFSVAAPASQLALMAAAPQPWYQRHRTAVTLAFRGAYLAFTSPPVGGFGNCAAGSYAWPHGVPRVGESAFSALLWRSGIIALWWYPAAFPLLFAHHLPAQLLFAAVYAARLAWPACRDIASVHHGAAAVRGAAVLFARLTDALLVAHGAPPAGGASGGVGGGRGGGGGGGGRSVLAPAAAPQLSCPGAVMLAQAVVGVLLPSLAIYCLEARARRAWLRRARAAVAPWLEEPGAAGATTVAPGLTGTGGAVPPSAASAGSSPGGSGNKLPTTPRACPGSPPALASEPASGMWPDDEYGLDSALPGSWTALYVTWALSVACWLLASSWLPATA